VFGTKVTRVTDANDGTLCVHAYAYWPAFNTNDTRLLVSCDGVPLLMIALAFLVLRRRS
jgi:hypothetical protein